MTPEERKDYFKEKMRLSRSKAKKDATQNAVTSNDISRATVFRKVKEVKQLLPKSPHKYARCVAYIHL